jgi:hypothetical protein
MVEVGDTGTFYHRTVPEGMEAIVQGIEETPDGDEITLYLEDGTEFIVLEHDILNYHEHELEDIAANEDLCIVEWDPYDSNNSNSNISTLPPPEPPLKRARIFGGRRKRSTRKRKQKRKRSTRKNKKRN